MELAITVLGILCGLSMVTNIALLWICTAKLNRPIAQSSSVTTGKLNHAAVAEPKPPAFFSGPKGMSRPEAKK